LAIVIEYLKLGIYNQFVHLGKNFLDLKVKMSFKIAHIH
jgi:hypothetical protein